MTITPRLARLGILTLLLLAMLAIYNSSLPNPHGLLGRHFAVTLPQLMDGHLWLHVNGIFTPPWFSPSFCGGLPLLAHPGNLFYSFPQWLTLFLDPLASVRWTFYLFAVSGGLGFFLLLHRSFNVSNPTSWVGAALFMGNGYYVNHMLVGQLQCHVIMLIPWMALLLTRPRQSFPSSFPNIAGTAMLLAYVVWSGAVFLFLPILIALILIGLTWGMHNHVSNHRFFRRLAGSLILALLLSAAKWWPGLLFLDHLGPAPVPLAFLRGVDDALLLLIKSLFFGPPGRETVLAAWQDPHFPLESTVDYAVEITLVPLILLAVAGFAWMHRRRGCQSPWTLSKTQIKCLTIIAAVATLPVALSAYSPLWNTFQRHAILWREGMPLVHTWSALVIPVILWSILSYEGIDWSPSHLKEQAWAIIFFVLALQALANQAPLRSETYDPNPILSYYHQIRSGATMPSIHDLGASVDPQTQNVSLPLDRNNFMVAGISPLFCNDPLFGDHLQRFPYQPLVLGSVWTLTDGRFNMKNPACYVAPEENQCRPGDHFFKGQETALKQLTHYQPYSFQKPHLQTVMEWIGAISFILLVSGVVWATMDFRNTLTSLSK
ncbi:MAG: hypothetical protein HQL73_09750 [Magnetococcales bacterium]|nr:hypothetical protein [Magnetococcales bacterium]